MAVHGHRLLCDRVPYNYGQSRRFATAAKMVGRHVQVPLFDLQEAVYAGLKGEM